MSKPFSELKKKISPVVLEAARAKTVAMLAEMSLAETRKAMGVNQVTLAKELGVAQANISQIESRPDALISTLAQYIEALGGKLEINATFPDGKKVQITQFSNR